jgi:acyl-CoA reductase-like NAD-dependent aldehyde dehydrogenase
VAAALREGSFWNAGQDCGAAARVLVSARGYDRMLAALVPAVESERSIYSLEEYTEIKHVMVKLPS